MAELLGQLAGRVHRALRRLVVLDVGKHRAAQQGEPRGRLQQLPAPGRSAADQQLPENGGTAAWVWPGLRVMLPTNSPKPGVTA